MKRNGVSEITIAGDLDSVQAPFTEEELAFVKACCSRPPRNAERRLREIEKARAARTQELRRKLAEGRG